MSKPQIKHAAKIPLLHTIARGCRETLRYSPVYTVQTTAWALIAVAAYLLSVLPSRIDSPDPLSLYYRVAAPYLPLAVMLLGAATISVSVYRAAILDEVPSLRKVLHLGARELRLTGFNLVFLVVGYVEMALLAIVVQLVGRRFGIDAELLFHSGAVSQVGESVAWGLLICITLVPLFGLVFPLIAIDMSSGTFRRSYVWSRGQRWRLAVIAALTGPPIQIIAYAPYLIWHGASSNAAHGLQIGLMAMVYLWGTAMRCSAFAVAFRLVANAQHARTYEIFD
jgi:hypothetical protein